MTSPGTAPEPGREEADLQVFGFYRLVKSKVTTAETGPTVPASKVSRVPYRGSRRSYAPRGGGSE
jgi:hypothetical protein